MCIFIFINKLVTWIVMLSRQVSRLTHMCIYIH